MNEEIKKAVEVMRAGGIILYPTDTVWGIGCDATNPEAIRKIFALKKRSDSKSMILLTDSLATVERYVEDIPEAAEMLVEAAVDPLTIIYDKGRNLPTEVLADDGSIAFRITEEPFSAALCRRMRKPIVSTSANISGEPSPRFFSEISDEIRNGVDYVVDWNRDDNTPHKPSSIIKVSEGGLFKIIR